jgi:DNA mismatch repair protein MLH1
LVTYILMKEKKISNCRSSVRQRRNPKETADITSVQELIEEIDCNYHSGEIFTHLFDC